MTFNFTTGIPEIDRLTGNRIANGSFFLAVGNDDEGMMSFLAAIDNNRGRPAGEDSPNPDSDRIIKITPENREEILRFCRSSGCPDETKMTGLVLIAESLSELCGGEAPGKTPSEKEFSKRTEENCLISFVREINLFLKNGTGSKNHLPFRESKANREGARLLIGCLHENILSPGTENRLKHLADCCIRFRTEEKGEQLERRLIIEKYKGTDAGGSIRRYIIDGGKLKIENKKRIY